MKRRTCSHTTGTLLGKESRGVKDYDWEHVVGWRARWLVSGGVPGSSHAVQLFINASCRVFEFPVCGKAAHLCFTVMRRELIGTY